MGTAIWLSIPRACPAIRRRAVSKVTLLASSTGVLGKRMGGSLRLAWEPLRQLRGAARAAPATTLVRFSYFALKVKLTLVGLPAATVTFWV